MIRLLALLSVLSIGCRAPEVLLPAENYAVLYGERTGQPAADPGVYRVYFDGDGSLYPTTPISDSILLGYGGRIQTYYTDHLAQQAGRADTTFVEWQSARRREISSELNREGAAYDRTFVLIHGFRKPFVPTAGGRTSQRDFDAVAARVREVLGPEVRARFLEVYWDGTYDCCVGWRARDNRRIFRRYDEEASVNAERVGLQLGSLLKELEESRVTLISHSLGAHVLLATAFDAFPEVGPEGESPRGGGYLPQDTVELCLIGPAVGVTPFENYYARTSAPGEREQDRYHLSVFYNPRDIVLRKKLFVFGPGARKFGNTSLGCDKYNAVGRLESLFRERFPRSPLAAYEVSIGPHHAWRQYAATEAFAGFLRR